MTPTLVDLVAWCESWLDRLLGFPAGRVLFEGETPDRVSVGNVAAPETEAPVADMSSVSPSTYTFPASVRPPIYTFPSSVRPPNPHSYPTGMREPNGRVCVKPWHRLTEDGYCVVCRGFVCPPRTRAVEP